ncbi:MAG: DUF362 domain-containing protein [Desulfomonile tiedjei]|nr:DUF362 domain-containing protein [Desulfomonile tiedjei]
MKHRVLIMRCDEYRADAIAGIIKEGMEELGVKPFGKTLLKPNCVAAHPELFPHAFTRAEFLEGAILAMKAKGEAVTELGVAERSGITIPTRWCFKNAGYDEVIARNRVRATYLDEMKHVSVELKHKDRLRDFIFVPKPIAECDFLVNLPKFKAHPWTRLTLALKNYIGLQDDRHRLVDHNSFLEHKIVDLQEVVQSSFIAIDAISAGQKMMLTPTPFHMGAIIMGSNACAVDTVGCHIVHVKPQDLVHLRMAAERGFGPLDLSDIEVGGDFPLDEIQERCTEFQFCLERVDRYFGPDGNLACSVGAFPEDHSRDYCWGGCPGALQEAVHIFRVYYPDILQEMKKVRYVVGKVEAPLNLEDGERVLFAGDCTSWQGNLNGEKLAIAGSYRTRAEVDAHKTRSNDMILKIVGQLWECFKSRSSRHLHARGCPVSVAAHVNYLSALGGVKNPNFDPRNVLSVNWAYLQMRLHRFWNHLFG